MTARAVGAFLVAMIAIGYLIGSFEGGLDLLIAALVSAGFAAIVELWLRRGERRDAVEPGEFDERATKRAVRRGVVRTAFVAVVWVLLAAIGLGIASSLWQTRGDRDDHLEGVIGYGFFAAQPGFSGFPPAGCCNTSLRSLELWLTADPKIASPLEQSLQLWFEVDLRGRLTYPSLPTTGVDAAQAAGPHEGPLGDLPDGVVATAVAELRRPLTVLEFHQFLARSGVWAYGQTDLAVYLQPSGPPFTSFGRSSDRRVSWPNPAVAGFQAWVKTLRSSDDRVLDGLGLPPTSELERIAATPRIYGFVLDQATPARLRAVESDPAVKYIEVGDIAFNLSASRS